MFIDGIFINGLWYKENEEKLEKYGYLIYCVENGNYDSAEYELQRIITETKKAPYVSDEYEEIEITIDNWKDYLEIKKNVNIFTDAFDEIESVSLLNCLYSILSCFSILKCCIARCPVFPNAESTSKK